MSGCPEYVLRLPAEGDIEFIASAWLKGAHEAPPNQHVPWDLFYRFQSNHIRHCVKSHHTYLLCHPDDPSELFGFVCFSHRAGHLLLHWLYIKKLFRRLGLAKSLLGSLTEPGKPIVLTQFSKYYPSLKKHFPLTYHPYHMHHAN